MKFNCEVIGQDSIEVQPNSLGGYNIILSVKGQEHRSWVKPSDCAKVAHLLICASEDTGSDRIINNILVQRTNDVVGIYLLLSEEHRRYVCVTPSNALDIASRLVKRATVESVEQELDGGYGLTDKAVFTKDEDGGLKIAVAIDSFETFHENTFTITQAELRSLGIIS